jgi:hypothetical protein
MADAHGCARYRINHGNSENGRKTGFNSLHPGGALFCMADASVHLLKDTIEWNSGAPVNTIFERLAAKDDGEVVSNFTGD